MTDEPVAAGAGAQVEVEVEVVQDALSYVCTHLDALRTTLRGSPGDPVGRLLEAVRTGPGVGEALDLVDNALLEAGDALGVFGRRDLPVAAGGPATRPEVPGLGAGYRVEIAFLCPSARCSRAWVPDATATAAPRCAMDDLPLQPVEL
ncbi:hypothetical protein ACFTWH_05985 [Streptomyces sp. NPDC057011]|uniref:hypothetical protein n=1 Tax=unclassified Streptomyces TaxID=2593676 RepID=UPI003639E888